MRQRWIFRETDGQLVPRGTKTAVYGFKVVSYASPVNPYTTATFWDGDGAGGTGVVKNIVSASSGTDGHEGGNDINEYIEFSDGVYVDVGTGAAAEAGILVYDGAGS